MQTRLLDHFSEQSAGCLEYGSPFTAELVARMRDDLVAGGPVAELVAGWSRNPRADAVALRLCGALHAAVLSGRDAGLAAEYPARRVHSNMARVWPRARALLDREREFVARFIETPPQTNEVRRSIALLLGFLHVADVFRLPLVLHELGASAGLNLHWDRFSYRTAHWRWGADEGVRVDTEWCGPAPALQAPLSVRARAACDARPLDVREPAQRLRLRSYIWADQVERLARFDAAASLAAASSERVEPADAADWLRAKLRARVSGATTVVYHSVFLQYPPRAVREAITHEIERAGASGSAPLAWLRLEPEALLSDARDSKRFLVDVVSWPGAEHRKLALTDGHVRSVERLL